MKNPPQSDDDQFPGFRNVWTASQFRLMVPLAVALEMREEQLRREIDTAEREKARALAAKMQSNDAVPTSQGAHETLKKEVTSVLEGAPKTGWHRVLPKLGLLANEFADPGYVERSADGDINKRRRRIVEKLVSMGPDRLVSRSMTWPEDLDSLEWEMPNFRGPIRLLRNALMLAEATNRSPRLPAILLLGPPGVGKTYFSRRVAEFMGTTRACVQFDQPSGGSSLRGLDSHYGNSEPGLLFNLIALGERANPVVLLDEIDKSATGSDRGNVDPLAQLLGALERETASRLVDASLDIEFDASLTTYIATANSLDRLGGPLLSRLEVFEIPAPNRSESADVARNIAARVLRRTGLEGRVNFSPQALHLLAFLTPRGMDRSAELAVAAAIASGRDCVGECDLWNEVTGTPHLRPH